MENIIEINNVNLSYEKNINILENLNLKIPKNSMVAIIGKSGVGKTTLFNSLLNDLKIQNGEIKIFGKNIKSLTKKEWKNIINNIGFLSQKNNLIEFENVFSNIKKTFSNYKNWFYRLFEILTKKQKEDIFEKLNELNILDKLFTRIDQLSGGQQKKVEIAKLLCKKVEIILADEPTSNLDYQSSKIIFETLKNINLKYKTSVLVITHNLDFLKKYFDYIIFVDKNNTWIKPIEEIDIWKIKEMMN